jgi:hypothetical protein
MAKKKAKKKEFVWSDENFACIATYNILEGEKFLDQFEDADIPFEDAGDTELGVCRYWLGTTTNSEISAGLVLQVAQAFFVDLQKTYTILKETDDDAAKTIQDLAEILAVRENTIADVARLVDARVHFPGKEPPQ